MTTNRLKHDEEIQEGGQSREKSRHINKIMASVM